MGIAALRQGLLAGEPRPIALVITSRNVDTTTVLRCAQGFRGARGNAGEMESLHQFELQIAELRFGTSVIDFEDWLAHVPQAGGFSLESAI